MSAAFPESRDWKKEPAEQGTAAHWALELTLKSMIANLGKGWLGRSDLLGMVAPNGVVIDDEMIDAVEEAVLEILTIVGDRKDLLQFMHIEQRVDISVIHPQCWGTCDVIIYDDENKILYVIDFKYGNSPVEVFENWQLMLYTIGCLHMWQMNDLEWVVDMRIVQPRSYVTSDGRWVLPASELRVYRDVAIQAASECSKPGSPTASTGSHCKYCPGRHACGAFRKTAANALEVSQTMMIDQLPQEAVSVELTFIARALEILKDRKTGLEQQVEGLLKKGVQTPGWAMRASSGKLHWSKDDQEVLALGKMIGVDLGKEVKPITPTQAKLKIKRAGLPVDDSVVDVYAQKGSSKMTLKPDNETYVKKIFSQRNRT
jgi:hypothetical protein